MLDEFYGDETLLTSHETLSFSLLIMSAKLIIFNAMKPCMKLALRMASYCFTICKALGSSRPRTLQPTATRPILLEPHTRRQLGLFGPIRPGQPIQRPCSRHATPPPLLRRTCAGGPRSTSPTRRRSSVLPAKEKLLAHFTARKDLSVS